MNDNQVSNEQLLDVLLVMKQDIGEIKAASASSASIIERHTVSIQELQMSHARLKGFAGALAVVGSVIGAFAGYAAEFFHRS
jgi:hypothetical protein